MSPKHFSDNHVHLMYVDSNGMRDLARESDLRTPAKLANPSKGAGHTHMSLYFIGLRHTCFLSYVACHTHNRPTHCLSARHCGCARSLWAPQDWCHINFVLRFRTLKIQRWIQSTSRSLVAGAEVRRRSVQGQLHAKKCLILTNCLIHMSPCQSNQNKIKNNKALVK